MTTKKSSRKRTTGGTEKRPAKRKASTSLAEYEADRKAGGPVTPPAADVGAGAKKSARAGQRAEDFHRLQLERLDQPLEAVELDEMDGKVCRPPGAKKGGGRSNSLAILRDVADWVETGFMRLLP